MSSIGPKDHFWTWQPYLTDSYGSYCDRCGKVRRAKDGKIISHTQALREVWQQHPELRKELRTYTSPRTFKRLFGDGGER